MDDWRGSYMKSRIIIWAIVAFILIGIVVLGIAVSFL